jgi:hypothetical protein
VSRLVLMFLAIAVVVGGGIYYFFGIHSPARDKRLAQEEIERWEPGLVKVRTCLLGATPASPKAGEAIAIRELTEKPDYKKCTTAIAELSRNGDDTGDARIENAWRTVNTAAAAVASGFGALFIPGADAKERAVDKLGAAWDSLDQAHRTLRAIAGMDPPPSPTAPALRTAELIPLKTGSEAKLSAWLRPSAGGMIVLVERALPTSAPRQVVLVPGEAPRLSSHQGDVRPSITDETFAAATGDGELELGKLDNSSGALAEPVRKVKTGDKKAVPHLLFTIGGPTDAVIGYIPDAGRSGVQVALARVTGEAVDAGTPNDADDYAFAVDPPAAGQPYTAARGLLVWSAKGALKGAIVRPAAPTKIVDLGSGSTGVSCMTATHGWVASGDQFVSFDDAGATPRVLPGHELIGCDATSALMRKAGQRYSVCAQACRIVDLQAGTDALPALSGGQVIAVAGSQRVLAVWREKAPPLYVRLPSAIKPKLVHATAKVIDVIGESYQGLVIARVKL